MGYQARLDMARTNSRRSGLTVAVTGATGDLGALLLPRLEDDPRVERILSIDVARPATQGPKVEFHRVDLSQPGSETDLEEVLSEQGVDALYHLAFIYGRVHNASFA